LKVHSGGPKQPLYYKGVNIGRIHSQPRGMTSRRCGLLPYHFGQLLLLSYHIAYTQCIRCGIMLPTQYRGLSVYLSVCVCVCLLVTFVSPGKTTESIEVPFGWMSRVDPRNHALDGDRFHPRANVKGQFVGWTSPLKGIVKHRILQV